MVSYVDSGVCPTLVRGSAAARDLHLTLVKAPQASRAAVAYLNVTLVTVSRRLLGEVSTVTSRRERREVTVLT